MQPWAVSRAFEHGGKGGNNKGKIIKGLDLMELRDAAEVGTQGLQVEHRMLELGNRV